METKQGDLRNMDYPDDYFDDTYCISVLEHGPINLNHIIPAIDELLRVTKRNLIVTMDVGMKPTISGPLSLEQTTGILKHLHAMPEGKINLNLIIPDDIGPYTTLCLNINKKT